jgi:YHS domain-containing protein
MDSMPFDPVCGMQVDAGEARAGGLVSELRGKTWFFCSPECKRDFEADPDAFLPSGR